MKGHRADSDCMSNERSNTVPTMDAFKEMYTPWDVKEL